jgi:hypothetical protein
VPEADDNDDEATFAFLEDHPIGADAKAYFA